jgi:trehalose 6-phosphate synthase
MSTVPLAHPDDRSLVHLLQASRRPGSTIRSYEPHLAARGSSLIIVTNRGPVEFVAEENQAFTTHPGSGGVVTALADGLSQAPDLDVTWIALARTPGDRAAFAGRESTRTVALKGRSVRLRYVVVPEAAYDGHYNVVSNEVLWFLQHYLWSPESTDAFTHAHEQAWVQGYRAVNDALAEAVVAAVHEIHRAVPTNRQPPVILVQDYHLYLVPGRVRAVLPEAVLAHFVHIPWPVLRYWQFLPHEYLMEIISSLAQCNLLGFQTPLDASNYLQAAQHVFPASHVDLHRGTVEWGAHHLRVGNYPVTIDAASVRRAAAVKTIVRVDRCEPTKNILRGFQAYQLLLEQHPELRGQVQFQAFLVPSRQDVPLYQRYARQVDQAVMEINRRFQTADWTPIQVIVGNNRPRALAAMREADVLLVNPLMDGMNLVAKEAVVVNEQDGVLVLSRTAGAHYELEGACLSISPTDVRETTQALFTALTMSAEARHQLAHRARAIVEARSPSAWLLDQVADALAAGAEGTSGHDTHRVQDPACSQRQGYPLHAATRHPLSNNHAMLPNMRRVARGMAARPDGDVAG